MRVQGINFRAGWDNAWGAVANFVPKFLAFLVILIIGYIVAKVIAKILTKVLQKVGFDRLVERGGIKRALADSQYDAAAILSKIVFYAIMLFVLSTAFGVFGSNPINDYLRAIIAYLPLVFVAIIIIVIAAAIAAGAKLLIQNSLGGLSYAKVLANCASALILALGVIAALDQLHFAQNVVDAVLYAALAAIVGIAVVAVGGGGIKTMSERWQRTADKYDQEKPRIAEAARNAPSMKEQGRQAMHQAQPEGTPPGYAPQYPAPAQPYPPQPGQPYPPGASRAYPPQYPPNQGPGDPGWTNPGTGR